jgi:hypothetical protein
MSKTHVADVEVDPKTDQYSEGPHLKQASPAQRGSLPEGVESAGIAATAVQHMMEQYKRLSEAENSLSKGSIADAITSIIPVIGLPEESRPTQAKIAEYILTAQGRDVRAVQVVKLPDGEVEYRPGKSNAYRQLVTRHIDLARWEAGMWSKAEQKYRDEQCGGELAIPVNIDGVAYTSPIDAIRAGQYFTTVHRLFKNALSPSFQDLGDVEAAKTEKLGRDSVKAFKAPIRGRDKDGKLKKARVPVAGNAAMTHGAILGLLVGLKTSMTQKRWDELQAELLKVQPAAQ